VLDPLVFGNRPRERPRDSCLAKGHEKGHEISFKYLLVFLEPLSVFQDKTLCEELWYLDVLCLKSRFVSISINTQRKQIAHRMAVNMCMGTSFDVPPNTSAWHGDSQCTFVGEKVWEMMAVVMHHLRCSTNTLAGRLNVMRRLVGFFCN